MINKTIEKLLNDKEIKNLIKNHNYSNMQIFNASDIIGEVYTYCIACNDGKDITKPIPTITVN